MPIKEHFLMESPLGILMLVNTDGILSGLYMPGHLRGPGIETLGSRTKLGFEIVVEQLHEYFDKQRTVFSVSERPSIHSGLLHSTKASPRLLLTQTRLW